MPKSKKRPTGAPRGRPPAIGEARDQIAAVRLTADEFAAWSDAARADGRTLSNWVRHVVGTRVLGGKP